ncbi:MAG TPA: polymer-forming cytoskeletal protein [Vicinamibacterales bacterium]|nr:polymer-forming cytoskeletal protein [Vicinamibacterales bacterium]
MSIVGASLVIVGEVRATSDLTVDGRIEGPVSCEGSLLTIPASASVEGPVLARDIIVFGRAEGQLIATEVVDLRPGSVVTGSIVAPSLILHDGALFSGRVEPNQLDAAVSVARFQQKQRDAQAG